MAQTILQAVLYLFFILYLSVLYAYLYHVNHRIGILQAQLGHVQQPDDAIGRWRLPHMSRWEAERRAGQHGLRSLPKWRLLRDHRRCKRSADLCAVRSRHLQPRSRSVEQRLMPRVRSRQGQPDPGQLECLGLPRLPPWQPRRGRRPRPSAPSRRSPSRPASTSPHDDPPRSTLL